MAVSSWFSQLQNGDFPELCGCLPEGTITDKSTLQRGGWNFTAFRDGWVCPPVSAVFAGTSCWIEACPSLSVRFTFQTKQTQKLHLNILQLSNVVCSKLRDTPHATFYPQKKTSQQASMILPLLNYSSFVLVGKVQDERGPWGPSPVPWFTLT